MASLKPIILGCAGPVLTSDEKRFFSELGPFGFILFRRNCEDPAQLQALTRSLRDVVEREDVPIFIDQEGGRVARLRAPHWQAGPPFRNCGQLYEQNPEQGAHAVCEQTRQSAAQLLSVGINANCAPVLDLMIDGASEAIGDRALSADPDVVAACGRLAVAQYLQEGVYPVIKHMPGHGRVKVDPHIEMPYVDASASVLEADFKPFRALRDAPMAMNCHVLFRALDDDYPVSLSRRIHRDILRGEIGFSGLILSDDIAMGSLRMPLPERAPAVLAAGADVAVFCSGEIEENRAVCSELPPMKDESLERWLRAKEQVNPTGQ